MFSLKKDESGGRDMASKVMGGESWPNKEPRSRKNNGNTALDAKRRPGVSLPTPMASRRSVKTGNAAQLVLPRLDVPAEYAALPLAEVSRDQLLEVLEANNEGGIKIAFSGKSNARTLARAVRPRVSRLLAKHSIGTPEERARNTVVEGDNLQAMATLYKERGQVDLIVTDPPYNTGKDFRYNDRWDVDPNDPGLGEFVADDDGARHTKWMRFMWPRLQMMKAMLKPTGVLAICIDHRELFRLGQMLDELFGEKNRIAIINWQKSYSPRNDNKHVSTATEYVLVYAKDLDKAKTGLLERSEEMNANYTNPDGDPEGEWASDNPCAGEGDTHPGMVYGIQSPFTGKVHYPPPGKCWRLERPRVKEMLERWGSVYESVDLKDGCPSRALMVKGLPKSPPEDHPTLKKARSAAEKVLADGDKQRAPWPVLFFMKRGFGKPRIKRYLKQVKQGVVPMTYWADDDLVALDNIDAVSWPHTESGHSQAGIKELDAIVGDGHGFETVKPLKLFQKIIQLWCPGDGLVMDPFAGSGTTGHAILLANKIGGTSRRFILIEQGRPENGDSYARTLLAERLRRVISGDWSHPAKKMAKVLGGGFAFLQLGKKVDAGALLQMERDEMVDTVIASHFDATRRRGDRLVRVEAKNGKSFRHLVAKNGDNEGFFLVWGGAGANTDFTEAVYEACAKEAEAAGVKASP